MSNLKAPYDRIYRSICEEVSAELEWMPDELPGKSPIEKALITALVAKTRWGSVEYEGVLIPKDDEHREKLLASERSYGNLIVQSQAIVAGWRVDFLVFAYAWREERWRKLIVECDGHDFHERTKEQAARDRLRDREAQAQGLTVFRFTGSQIYRDAWGCVGEIIDWAARGLG